MTRGSQPEGDAPGTSLVMVNPVTAYAERVEVTTMMDIMEQSSSGDRDHDDSVEDVASLSLLSSWKDSEESSTLTRHSMILREPPSMRNKRARLSAMSVKPPRKNASERASTVTPVTTAVPARQSAIADDLVYYPHKAGPHQLESNLDESKKVKRVVVESSNVKRVRLPATTPTPALTVEAEEPDEFMGNQKVVDGSSMVKRRRQSKAISLTAHTEESEEPDEPMMNNKVVVESSISNRKRFPASTPAPTLTDESDYLNESEDSLTECSDDEEESYTATSKVQHSIPTTRKMKESDIIGSGFARSNYNGDSTRTSMLQAPILERMIEADWLRFIKLFNQYRAQGGNRSLYHCIAESEYERIISHLISSEYADNITRFNLEEYVDANEDIMFIHLQHICGIVTPKKTRTEIQREYEMPYDYPYDLSAKNQQPIWASQIWHDRHKHNLDHKWVADTMLNGLKKHYPDLKEKLDKRFMVKGDMSSSHYIEAARRIDGEIAKTFRRFQLAREKARLRVKKDMPVMSPHRDTAGRRLMFMDILSSIKPCAPTSSEMTPSVNSSMGGKRTRHQRKSFSSTPNSNAPNNKYSTNNSNANAPVNRYSTNTSSDIEAGKRLFRQGKLLDGSVSPEIKNGYYMAKREDSQAKSHKR